MAEIKLLGSRYTKINSERKKNFTGKIAMKTGISLGDVVKAKDSKDTLEIEYRFNISYGELGKVDIEGTLYISSDPKTAKELLKAPKERDVQSKEFIAITNLVLQKASIKALELEEELGLPTHIRLPSVSPSSD